MLLSHFQASNRSDDIHYNGSAVKENQAFEASAWQTKMEKHSTQQSTVSSASRANKQTTDKELHHRLQTNNSSDITNTTMPNTPQRDHVHCTSSQNQCAQDSAGQNAPTPTLKQTIGNHTPTTGMDGDSPHRDRGTQMPSQEMHRTTITQGTQIPSQQWERTTTNEVHVTEQSSTNSLDTASLNLSSRLGEYQGTFARQPTQTQKSSARLNHTIEQLYTQNPSHTNGS